MANALAHGVSVLTGGPGTGKSRTVAAVVRAAERAGRSVALAAPTGRAAKRLAELCDAEAMTIHRLLGAQPRSSGESGTVDFSAGFARGVGLAAGSGSGRGGRGVHAGRRAGGGAAASLRGRHPPDVRG